MRTLSSNVRQILVCGVAILISLILGGMLQGFEGAVRRSSHSSSASGQVECKEFASNLREFSGLIEMIDSVGVQSQRPRSQQEAVELHGEFLRLKQEVVEFRPVVTESAIAALKASPTDCPKATQWLAGELSSLLVSKRSDEAARVARALFTSDLGFSTEKTSSLLNLAAYAAFNTNQFEEASDYFTRLKKLGPLSEPKSRFAQRIDRMGSLWRSEQAFLEKARREHGIQELRLVSDKGEINVQLLANDEDGRIDRLARLIEEKRYDAIEVEIASRDLEPRRDSGKGDESGDQPAIRPFFRGQVGMRAVAPVSADQNVKFVIAFIPLQTPPQNLEIVGTVRDGFDVVRELLVASELTGDTDIRIISAALDKLSASNAK